MGPTAARLSTIGTLGRVAVSTMPVLGPVPPLPPFDVDVFIQSYPDPGQKRQVSPAHGSEPMWTQRGRELVYREGDKVLAGGIDPTTGASDPPRVLFSGPHHNNPGWTRPRSYDVTPDGIRSKSHPPAPPAGRVVDLAATGRPRDSDCSEASGAFRSRLGPTKRERHVVGGRSTFDGLHVKSP